LSALAGKKSWKINGQKTPLPKHPINLIGGYRFPDAERLDPALSREIIATEAPDAPQTRRKGVAA
jgi:hypothetical protein